MASSNEKTNERDEVKVLKSSADTEGELFCFEYTARTMIDAPLNHAHEDQEERVEVLSGTLSCRVGEEEVVLQPGDKLTFPPGVPHAVWNADVGGSRTIGEFRPALDTEALFGAVFKMTSD